MTTTDSGLTCPGHCTYAQAGEIRFKMISEYFSTSLYAIFKKMIFEESCKLLW
jgi:hypothetical protein